MQKVIVLLRPHSSGVPGLLRAGPLARNLRARGAKSVATGKELPFVVASVSKAQEGVLAASPGVRAVLPDAVIPALPTPASSESDPLTNLLPHSATPATVSAPCGTASHPENDPEANGVVKATQANELGFTGKGVKVAYIAGSIDTTIPDFKRNPKYASAASPAGSPVVTQVNFSGDSNSTPSGENASEAFGDASSIAAQGNTVFNLADFVNPAHPLPATCDIRVTGAAPGASVLGLSAFAGNGSVGTTTSGILQAIDYAVSHGVRVLNESFGGNPFPDTALDAVRIADDDAVKAGVTVVTSTGDAGVTNTLGSPATDPKLISVGASTTFRAYQQETFGGINATVPNATNGTWIDNNISSLSSGGFSQSGGNTVDLVAPGDLNWLLCSPNVTLFTTCFGDNGVPSGLQVFGGTSESSPITAAAAADVIQAYASTHRGQDPSPALVKQILVSTANDVAAPAEQQGAGLLNVLAAVRAATTYRHPVDRPGALLVDPTQINIQQGVRGSASRVVRITNTFHHSETVNLSTRALTHRVASQTGAFCLNPSSAAISCGPPTANTFQIWSGVTEVYQEETFTVPRTGKPSRLNFSATYPFTGQTSLLHVALYDPSGAYAGYSLPQGLADYANIQVANPKPGTWTAVFFTELNGNTPGGIGTSGTIQWQADTWTYGHGGAMSPTTMTIAPGATKSATFTEKSPGTPGDTSQSIVLKSSAGTNTIPVTIRTTIPVGATGGHFAGVLTGGNGRGNPAATNTYMFRVPAGLHDLDASATFADLNDGVVAYLVDPHGEAVASSSNVTLDTSGKNVIGTNSVNVYKDNPQPGEWELLLNWLQPVSGTEISEPFSGRIMFNKVSANANLPRGGATLEQGEAHTFDVRVTNTAQTPESFFLDPRTTENTTIQLPDQNGSDQSMTLPLPPGLVFPLYVVPPDSTQIHSSLTGTGPVTYDMDPFPGDPDLSPAVPAPGAVTSQSGNSASLTYTAPGGELAPGLWGLFPAETGPYPSTGAPPVTASASVSVVTKGFDSTVTPSTGDLWTFLNGFTSTFNPVYLQPGASAVIPLTITPTAPIGTHVTGTINLDDVFQANFATGFTNAGGDELASLPFSYTVKDDD